ncbi:MAG TPA: cysteine hydrolase [Desulfobacteraceae bacterium]|nr:cysteine hydrolase [Desulfobacteraceae bacterium]|tara:strand:+ start:693 stop:1352 length:660 start_codon:yes stop_codon:yes gene_type:complete
MAVVPLSREVPVSPEETALLFVDVQNLNARPEGGVYKSRGLDPAGARKRYDYYFNRLQSLAIPNMTRLQSAFRNAGAEVLYTVIENLTRDGRDRSLDYKLSGFNVPKGSWDARVMDEIRPGDDEMVFPKSSSSVFISTNLHYILGNLGVRYLVVCGMLTDQCISSTVRDACDLGYLVTLVPDACATYTAERHRTAIDHIRGYCRQRLTDALLQEVSAAG